MASYDGQKLSRILIALGVLIVGVGLFWSQLQSLKPSPLKKLAVVQRETGNIQIFHQHHGRWENLNVQDQVYERDLIQTNDLGEAKLIFANGSVAKITHDSLVTLERGNDSGIALVVRQGDIRALETPESGTIVSVLKNGEQIPLANYNDSLLASEQTQTKQSSTTLPGLQESEITQVLQSKRGSFFKCYAQILQKNPELKGDVSVGLTILPTGKVASVFLTSASLTDDSFKKCLSEIIEQIEFRRFSGEPLTARLPLKFE